MQIVDPHHHLWDLKANYYPWLTDRITPRVCGPYAAIRKDYLIGDFRRDIDGLDIVASVHVQAEHDPRDPVRETRWLQSIADDAAVSAGFPHGIVAFCDLSDPRAEETLDAHCRFANVRGIRQSVNGVVDRPADDGDLLRDPTWRSNLGVVGRFGLSFDLQLYPQQVNSVLPLLHDNPDMQFVLCHTGLPADQSAEGAARWRGAMRELAGCGNVAVKISGFGMFDRQWTGESIQPFVRDAIDMFGAERCMFASNYPVDGMAASYRRIWATFDGLTADLSPAERQALFCGNALRIYRLEPRLPTVASDHSAATASAEPRHCGRGAGHGSRARPSGRAA
jgi:predicted TIM-barrel fold metal-dependent hydrolase